MKTFDNVIAKYIWEEFYDSEYGAFYASINASKEDIVTEDKILKDLAAAIIFYSEKEDTRYLLKLISDIDYFRDKNQMGFYELIDSTNSVHNVGRVRTFLPQLLAGFALYSAGKVLCDNELKNRGFQYVTFVLGKYTDNNFPTLFSEDWNTIMDTSVTALDVSSAIIITLKVGLEKYIPRLLEVLEKFQDGNNAIFSRLYRNREPQKEYGKLLKDMAVYSLALSSLYEQYKKEEYLLEQELIFHFIDRNLRNPLLGGFWNRCNCDNTPAMDGFGAYYKNLPAYPYKSSTDEALLLIAIKSYLKNKESKDILDMRIEIEEEVKNYYDFKNGGLNLGKGCWFASATDPTVPLARQTNVPAHTLGSFYVGNTNYVPLQQKQLGTQIIAAMALQGVEYVDTKAYVKVVYEKEELVKGDYITKGQLTNSYVDMGKYVKWLRKTKSGSGYGLTAYKSPMGFRADKSPQNFSALHVISDLTVLNEEIEGKEDTLKLLYSSQNEDGGFGEQPSLLSEVFTTYCVVLSGYILKDSGFNKEKCIKFIQSCQNKDGGFGNAPGYPSDAWHTNLAVLTLHSLNNQPSDIEGVISYLFHCQNEDGGYGVNPGKLSETYSTFRAISSLKVLGVKVPEKEKTIKWLQGQQTKEGGFIYQKGKFPSFVGTYHAIAALYLLGEIPIYLDECKKWLAAHQMKDGGFSRTIYGPSDTTDEGFIVTQASFMLEKLLNPYWVAIIT